MALRPGVVRYQSAAALAHSLTYKLLSPFSSAGTTFPIKQWPGLSSHNITHHSKPNSTDGQKRVQNTAAIWQALMQQYSIWGRCSVARKQNLWIFPLPSILLLSYQFKTKSRILHNVPRDWCSTLCTHMGLKREFWYISAKKSALYQFGQGKKNPQLSIHLQIAQDSAKTKLQWPVVCSISWSLSKVWARLGLSLLFFH